MADGEGNGPVAEDMASLDVSRLKDVRIARAPKRARLSKQARKHLSEHDREKPTRERAEAGEYARIDAAKFDSSRRGEKILMDLKARAGGAGEMYARGQIGERQLVAAAKLCELHETMRASQMSGGRIAERVEGGGKDASGARLASAADAAGAYRAALMQLSRAGRFLVEKRVVFGMAMEEIVQLKAASEPLGGGKLRKRCENANVLLKDALDQLADVLDALDVRRA